jgi:hypothetical protein
MGRDIELSALDLRYESYRLRQSSVEARLLSAIAERGIEEPLEGVGNHILLNGFKRYRCARKLKLSTVPYVSLGEDEVVGITSLLRTSNDKALSILEQAAFIDELKNVRGQHVGEIADELSRSKAWVSMRAGLIAGMSPKVRQKLFRGEIPVYSYMYTLRQFMRMNGVTGEQVEQFVEAVSGRNLSVRDIERLAHGCFRGPESFRQEVFSGNITIPLAQMKQVPESPDGCNEFERVLLKDIEIAQKYMQRIMSKSKAAQLTSRTFYAQSNLLTAGILSRVSAFTHIIRALHDRSGQA